MLEGGHDTSGDFGGNIELCLTAVLIINQSCKRATQSVQDTDFPLKKDLRPQYTFKANHSSHMHVKYVLHVQTNSSSCAFMWSSACDHFSQKKHSTNAKALVEVCSYALAGLT